MAIELIIKIKEMEEQAEQVVRKSLTDAKKMAADAEKEASRILEEAQREADELYRNRLDEAGREALAVYEDILRSAREECGLLAAAAEQNMAEAVAAVYRKVVS